MGSRHSVRRWIPSGLRLALLLPLALFPGALLAEPAVELSVPDIPGGQDIKTRMSAYYEPVRADFKAGVPAYPLPLKMESLTNADQAQQLVANDKLRAIFTRNGFTVTDYGQQADVVKFYDMLKKSGTPIFVTSDSLLHLYHIQFDETLRAIEEREFYPDAIGMSRAIQSDSLRLYGALDGDGREAARRCVAYATIALELLAEDTLRARVQDAAKFARDWKGDQEWQFQAEFDQKYPDILKGLAGPATKGRIRGGGQPSFQNRQQALTALEGYLKEHATGKVIPVETPPEVKKDVDAELTLIRAHQGFSESPLFRYKEDYSQYVPRGHYTRSEELKRYFRALMWYGRMTFLIKGGQDALVSEQEARIQTLAGTLLASMMDKVKVEDGRTLAAVWDRLYSVTAYYVGLADDLTPYEYRTALRSACGDRFPLASLTSTSNWFKFRSALTALRSPEIYSGTGNVEGPPPAIATEADLVKALDKTKGLRLMGQRYIPDSYMMGQLVYPTVGQYAGKGQPFTRVDTDFGPIRGFPRGLDVMAVLGSDRAKAILKDLGDDAYARYDEKVTELRKKFAAVTEAGWNRNMYWSWLHALQALLKDPGAGYPSFMQNDAWKDKQLNAALGSWSQLRHDTILYAKQSYTMMVTTAMPMEPRMVEGYIEPVPEFYARVLALTRMTRKGLDDMKVLDDQSRGRIESLEGIVERLLNLSMQELQGKALQPEDYGFINSFGEQLKAAVAGVDQEGLDTTIIADVHTDANSGQVLEEGTGNIRGIVVAYPMPDGGVVAGVGPVFSYYEFRHPMANRLTDEAWKAMLREGKAPALPEWAASFSAEAAGARIPPGGGPGGRIRGPIRRLDPGVEKVIDVPVKIDALPERRPKQKLEPVPAPAPEIKQKDKPE